MLQKNLSQLFERDLEKLKTEIDAYTNETDLWKTEEGISNSGGNLCLHLIGNLKHFIGKLLGNSSYERQRDKEFSDKNIPPSDLLKAVDETIAIVNTTLENLSANDFQKIFPSNIFGEITTESFIMHLYGHLNYHLGQINFHRRLLNR